MADISDRGAQFQLFAQGIFCSEGRVGIVRSWIYFDVTDPRDIETIYADLRGKGYEIEGIGLVSFPKAITPTISMMNHTDNPDGLTVTPPSL